MKCSVLKKISAAILSFAMAASVFAGLGTAQAAGITDTDITVIDDETCGNAGWCALQSSEIVKEGSYSFKATPGWENHDYWMIRRDSLPAALNIAALTENGSKGALRFWVYVEDVSTVSNWKGAITQLGAGWDRKVYHWNWLSQIKNNGWNEIILPFSAAEHVGGDPDYTNITYLNTRTANAGYKATVYFDSIKITADTAPSDNIRVLNDESYSDGIYAAAVSREKSYAGLSSYKCMPGQDGHWRWCIRTDRGLGNTLDIRRATENGTKGALRFWLYTEDCEAFVSKGNAVLQLGAGWDTNVYAWGINGMVTKNGWNEIILPFGSDTGKIGTPDLSAVNYLNIIYYPKTEGAEYAEETFYIDDMRITADAGSHADVTVIDDEAGQCDGIVGAVLETDGHSKVGKTSYEARTAVSGRDYWIFRTDRNLPNAIDISGVTENGTAGALHFWVWIEDKSTVENWNGSQVQLGAGWDRNVFVWSNMHSQIVRNGWNEIFLPIASAAKVGGAPDLTNITYLNIRTGNTAYEQLLYIDDIKVTRNYSENVTLNLIDEENGVSGGFCDEISAEQVKAGDYAHKATTGVNGHDYWIIRQSFDGVDISAVTGNGKSGALRFWLYVEDAASVSNWNGSQLQLGEGWDKNVFVWGGIEKQIFGNGWNEIILNFGSSTVIGAPDLSDIKFMLFRTGNAGYQTTVYTDSYRITSATSRKGDLNGDGKTDLLDLIKSKKACTAHAEENVVYAADINGNEKVDATDLAELRKVILGIK